MRKRLALVVLLLAPASVARAATDLTFAYDDARLLQSDEHDGGLAHFRTGGSGNVPLLVFLHGVNERGPLHRGLGAGGYDLRAIVDELADADAIEPPMVAGPSQTRDAWTGSKLWGDFDLDEFVAATEKAVGVKVDRGRIILVGHSGAGCNPTGGLLAPLGTVKPLAIVPIDVCMDDRFGRLFGERAGVAPVHVLYQDALWPREFSAFKSALDATTAGDPARKATVTRYDAPGANSHEEIVRVGLRALLPVLLPPPDDD